MSVDCRGGNAAEAGGSQSGGSAGPCATDAQAVTTDRRASRAADAKVQADERALAAAAATLSQGEASAATYGQTPSYTMLPKVGQIVRRGRPLYAIGGAAGVLLYGGVPAWRAFMPGMSAGADVAELNANLRALGYGAESATRSRRRRRPAIARVPVAASASRRRAGYCSARSCSSRAQCG